MEWLRERKTKNPHWFWALIAVSCWTVILQAIMTFVLFFWTYGVLTQGPSTDDYLLGVLVSFMFALPSAALLAGPAWVALLIAGRKQHIGGAVLAAEGLFLAIPVGSLLIGTANNIAAGGGFDTTDTLFCGGCGCMSLLLSTPPLVAGIVLLAGWRTSETSQGRQDSE